LVLDFKKKNKDLSINRELVLFLPTEKLTEKLNMSEKDITSFDVLIEIPKGSRNKYEYDFKLKKVRYDRMIFSSMMYPADYGFVPETLALDGDPLDVLVLVTEPTFPGCVMEVKPIGVFHMADEKGPDEKIICVPVSDPNWNKANDLSDLNPHFIKEIEHFFKVYKDLEKKKVDVGGWGDVHEAKEIVAKCLNRFNASDTPLSDVTIK
jgi:inorganic pyrophosphatase